MYRKESSLSFYKAHRTMSASMQQRYQATPPSRTLSPRALKGPMTSTPTKEPPSARRCLPLNMEPYYGRSPLQQTPHQYGQMQRYHSQGLSDEVIYGEKKKNQANYQSVENAFIARTAVVSRNFLSYFLKKNEHQ